MQLILLSPDQGVFAPVREQLLKSGGKGYRLRHLDSLAKLQSFAPESICHAILVDVQASHSPIVEVIDWMGGQHSNVVLIALYHDCKELPDLGGVDDFLRFEQFSTHELFARIGRARLRRVRENKLIHEQSLLQSLLDNVSDSIFFKDTESRFTKVNRQMITAYGQGHDSLIGKTDFDLFSEEHAHATYRDEQEIIRSGKNMEPKLEKKTFEDGRINWMHTLKVPLRNACGKIIGTMGIARDITDLKNAEDTLKSKQTMLRTIIDHALAGIFVKDRDGHYLLVNKQHTAYLGKATEADIVGKTLYDFVDAEKAERISAFDQEIMESGKAIENLVDCREKGTPKEFWLLTNKVPLRDETGHIVGLVGITLNITKQKQAEEALKKTIQLLEETRLQLIEAEKFKTVGRLAAGVAHEVKNPLNVVSLGAEYLESIIDGPAELLDVLKDMREAVEKANRVIFELLDYSSPNQLSMEPGDVNEQLHRVMRLMRHNFAQAGISVIESLDDMVEPVNMDNQKMEQVFINVLLNAIKAMPDGGTLIVRSQMIRMQKTGANSASEMSALFRVGDPITMVEFIDSGGGIGEECAARAFEPFYSTKDSGQGTGLGLSVCKSIIDLHHGLISLGNREDAQGACMRILLPATRPD